VFHRGHVYWVEIPDEPGRKRRPALVLSPDVRNALAGDVIGYRAGSALDNPDPRPLTVQICMYR